MRGQASVFSPPNGIIGINARKFGIICSALPVYNRVAKKIANV